MRQSTVIFGTLLAAFVVYITIRGQLPSYLSLFTGGTAEPTLTNKNSTTNDNKGSSFNTGSVVTDKALKWATQALGYF